MPTQEYTKPSLGLGSALATGASLGVGSAVGHNLTNRLLGGAASSAPNPQPNNYANTNTCANGT